jgi:hypothetical protein
VSYEDRIDVTQERGAHIRITCKNHPELRWSTKNIGSMNEDGSFYMSRNIFFFGVATEANPSGEMYPKDENGNHITPFPAECPCSARDLRVVKPATKNPEGWDVI